MKKSILLATLALCGCTSIRVQSHNYDQSLLTKCAYPSRLEGLDGKSVLEWAGINGPGIVDCVRNHNALVEIIVKSRK